MKPVRRSQAISPFGPGAMVDFPGPVSLIHAAIDAWPFEHSNPEHREFMIEDEPRLAHRLGVNYFVMPPDFRRPQRSAQQTVNPNLKLPFLRFPRWHVCPIPSCGKMHFAEYHDRAAPMCRGRTDEHSHKPRKTFQVRFVAACSKGHLADFPWLEWVFKCDQEEWKPNNVDRWLTLKSSGSASLTSMQVSAEQRSPDGKVKVVKKRSLAGAFGNAATVDDEEDSSKQESPLSRIGVYCTGANPVLATGTEQRPAPGCGEHLQVVLKNATNIYFPNVVSSIYIPEVEDSSLSPEILELLDDRYMKPAMREAARTNENDGLVSRRVAKRLLEKHHPESDVTPEDLADAANTHLLPGFLLDDRGVTTTLEQIYKSNGGSLSEKDLQAVLKKIEWAVEPSKLLSEITRHLDSIMGKNTDPENLVQPTGETPEEMSEEEAYRRQEYRVFTQDIQTGFSKRDLDIHSTPIQEYTELAACNFQRIALLKKLRETRAFDGFSRMYSTGLTREERRSLFSAEDVNWLPAIIVRGEGIFVEFNHSLIAKWEEIQADALQQRLKLLHRSVTALAARRRQDPVPIAPGFLLLHTFAHILITELVQQCGYGSASLRERIYSGSDMSGVLIYTSAGDSEGTMGGLVRMGEPDRFGKVVLNAINRARWCSGDPVCIESKGQGPDNCNLAACHSCALLPETSCEVQNRLLDRSMLVGTLENPAMGFFADVLS